jgi:hypothetical protein
MTRQESSMEKALYQLRAPIIAILITIAVGVVAIVVALPRMSPDDQDSLWVELGKAGIQAIVVAAAGFIVTAGLKYMEDQRETAQRVQDAIREEIRQRNEYRLDLLRRLRTAYSTIKRVRRELEIAGFKPASTDPFTPATGPVSDKGAAAYQEGIAVLREVKLELEAMREELPAGVRLRGKSTPDLMQYLEELETYLDDEIIDEQRALPPAVTTAYMPAKFEQVPKLQQFVAPTHKSARKPVVIPPRDAFAIKVSSPYHKAARVLVNDILTLDSDAVLPAGTTSPT